MLEGIDHNKIIQNAARTVLAPRGFIQKGTSRTWISDNSWFFTVVEFQPSAYAKGSYLNVGIHFLWAGHDYISFDIGGRKNGFVEFDGDEAQFYSNMVSFSEKALEYNQQYCLLKEKDGAKEFMLSNPITHSLSWDLYHKMMFCGFVKDSNALCYFSKLKEKVMFSAYPFEVEIRRELTEQIGYCIEDTNHFYQYVCEKITNNRKYWQSKSSLRRLNTEISF